MAREVIGCLILAIVSVVALPVVVSPVFYAVYCMDGKLSYWKWLRNWLRRW